MSQVATAAVVANKLEPIGQAPELIGQVLTGQAGVNAWEAFEDATNFSSKHVCSALVSFIVQGRNATPEDFANATSAAVESTRVANGEKREDTPRTPLARKFQSMARTIFGAVRTGTMALEEVQGFTNSQSLYDTARKVLAERQIDWKGISEAAKAADKAKREQRKAIVEAAEEDDIEDVLTLTPDQFKALKGKAAEKLKEKQARAKLESMEKRAAKMAKDLLASYGPDDAETVLKMALEQLTHAIFAG
jgi:hypothetical protein